MDYSHFKPIVNLSIDTLIRSCSINPNYADSYYCDFYLLNRNNIHTVFSYKKFNDDFTSYVTCYSDCNYFIGIIRPCYEEFLYKLQILLNIKPEKKPKDDRSLTRKLNDRLLVLKNIHTEQELRQEFPLIHKDLVDGRNFIRNIEKLEKNNPDLYRKQKDYYYSCALKKGLNNFIQTQFKMYSKFINSRHLYKDKVENTNYNSYIRSRFDMDKVAMYTAHECLKICEDSSNLKTIRFYLLYLDKYLSSDYKKDVSLTTTEGVHVDFTNIKNRIINVKHKIEGNSSVNWIILPKGKKNNKVSLQKEKKPKKTVLNSEQLNYLRKKGEQKKRFYEGTNYLVKAIGLLKYQGYCARIYENGEVILDREYKEGSPSTATGDAIYNIKAYDFLTLSKLDKSILRKHPRVNKINHTATWEERVRTIIEKEGTKEEQESAVTLIKKLKS